MHEIWSFDWTDFQKKNIKIVAMRCQILRLNAPNSISSEAAPPQTPLGELTALPQTPSWI